MEPIVEFKEFLALQYNFRNVESFSCINTADVSTLFLAETSDGSKVIIKRTNVQDLCENEYSRSLELYEIDSRYFAKPIAFHEGAPFSFSAQQYMPSVTLIEKLKDPALTAEEKAVYIEDLYNIYIALKKSNVVHRDIHFNNVLVHEGHLILVDFQIAVQKTAYKELKVYENELSLVQYRGSHIFCLWAWDDAQTLLQILHLIGVEPGYEERYREIEKEMTSHIGKDTIWYRLPSSPVLLLKRIVAKWKAAFTKDESKRVKYEKRAKQYDILLRCSEHKGEKCFPLINECQKMMADFINN